MIRNNNALFNLRSQRQVEQWIQEESSMNDCTKRVIQRNDPLNENTKQNESLKKFLISQPVKSCSNQKSHPKVSI